MSYSGLSLLGLFVITLTIFSKTGFGQSADFGTRGIPVAIQAAAEEENKSPAAIQSTDSVALEDGGKMSISIEPSVTVGQRANLSILATADCHIRVFHFSSDDHTTELFPGNSGKATAQSAGKKLVISWETTHPGGLEHILVFVSKGEILNTATDKGVAAGDFKVFKAKDVFSTRGIPTAIQAKEVENQTSVATSKPAKKFKILKARLCYHLRE